MTITRNRRAELSPFIGAAVSVEATIKQIEDRPMYPGSRQRQSFVLLTNMQVYPEDIYINHAWVKFGPVGTERIKKHGNRLIGAPMRLAAKVIYYETDGLSRLGLASPHDAEVFLKSRWRCINRNIERYTGDNFDDVVQDEMLLEFEREQQRLILEPLQSLPGRDKAIQQILDRFFVRGELVSDKQLEHARKATIDRAS